MSTVNLEVVQSVMANWERGDFRTTDWADPEIEYVIADGPAPGSWTGLGGTVEGVRSILSTWEEFRVEADQYQELDDERILVLTHISGRGKTSGMDLRQLWTKSANVFHVRGGKVTRIVAYFDRDRALADVGLPVEGGSSSA